MGGNRVTRRQFLKETARGTCAVAAWPIADSFARFSPFNSKHLAKKVVVLGIDGMDPVLLRRFMDEGAMPTFSRLAQSGYFGPLQTTIPPQSPVAWSSFITGTNPGGHGIYDFIHRDAQTFLPYLSTSRTFSGKQTLNLGQWSLPLESDEVKLLRGGRPFWSVLEKHDIPAYFFKLPANFPVTPGHSTSLSGMGTPDLLGSYGTFTYYTDAVVPDAEKFTGGRVVQVKPENHIIRTSLKGPRNSFRVNHPDSEVAFAVYRDPTEHMAKINIQDREIVLLEGEWSDWVPLDFPLMPLLAGIRGMVRFYLQQVHPEFRLYISPINIDPEKPTLPISSPPDYAADLARAIGRYPTLGFPEDTKALSNGVFSDEEFFALSKKVLEQHRHAFDYEFNRFSEGLFFFYFGSIDQNSHMLWWTVDPSIPVDLSQAGADVRNGLRYFYQQMDDVLRQVVSRLDSSTTLIIMSDHGFSPFHREFQLSTWLVEKGYTTIADPERMEETQFFDTVDWSATKAYALGLNSIYLNLHGRERNGSVMPDDAERIKQQLIKDLEAVIDPKTSSRVIAKAYDSRHVYHGPYANSAPDIIVGYERGYRISDKAVLGEFPQGILVDRRDRWAADHCMDPRYVPGVLLSNRTVGAESPGLWDIGPSILSCFGLEIPKDMDGKSVFV